MRSLAERIISRIRVLERRRARQQLALSGGLVVASAATLVPIGQSVYRSLVQTGFFEYLSLAASDQTVLSSYAREFCLSLLESLPVLSLIALFSLVGILWWSIIKTIKQYGLQANFSV